jgi:phosphoribosylformylglycinamidine synthase
MVLSCHDIADGGIASALAEMTFGNEIGCNVKIKSGLASDKILFSETGGFVLEVSLEKLDKIKSAFLIYGLDTFEIGTTGGSHIKLNGVVKISVNKTKESWTNGLRDKL